MFFLNITKILDKKVGKIFLKHLHNMSGQMLYSDIYINKLSSFENYVCSL